MPVATAYLRGVGGHGFMEFACVIAYDRAKVAEPRSNIESMVNNKNSLAFGLG